MLVAIVAAGALIAGGAVGVTIGFLTRGGGSSPTNSASAPSSAASAAAHARGLPAYVPPSPPGPGASMISARPTTAESGNPAARLFAIVMMSGSTPECSMANIFPVRPNPDWISSQMRTMP